MEKPCTWYPGGEVPLTMRGKWPDLTQGLEEAVAYIRKGDHEGLVAVAVRAGPPRAPDEEFFCVEISYARR